MFHRSVESSIFIWCMHVNMHETENSELMYGFYLVQSVYVCSSAKPELAAAKNLLIENDNYLQWKLLKEKWLVGTQINGIYYYDFKTFHVVKWGSTHELRSLYVKFFWLFFWNEKIFHKNYLFPLYLSINSVANLM